MVGLSSTLRGSPDINKKPHIFFYFRLSKIMVIGAYSGCGRWQCAKWLLTVLHPCLFLFGSCNVIRCWVLRVQVLALSEAPLFTSVAGATWESLIRQKCPVSTFTPCTFDCFWRACKEVYVSVRSVFRCKL